jgi:MFS family permease
MLWQVAGPLIGGALTQLFGFQWAAFYFGCGLLMYGALLLFFHWTGRIPWTHHRERTESETSLLKSKLIGHEGGVAGSGDGLGSSYASTAIVLPGGYFRFPEDVEDGRRTGFLKDEERIQ